MCLEILNDCIIDCSLRMYLGIHVPFGISLNRKLKEMKLKSQSHVFLFLELEMEVFQPMVSQLPVTTLKLT